VTNLTRSLRGRYAQGDARIVALHPPAAHTAAPTPHGAATIADSYISARAVIASHLAAAVGVPETRRLMLLADMAPLDPMMANALAAAEAVVARALGQVTA